MVGLDRKLKIQSFPDGFLQAALDTLTKLKEAPVTGQGLPAFGTEVLMNVINESGFLPTRNFQQGQFEGADEIGGETLADTLLVRNRSCFACPIACGRVSHVSDPRYPKAYEGPEYEAAWALGANTGVSDLSAVTKANFLCNQYSMDAIAMGSTLAAAMEMYERGILTEKETGRPLHFGDAEALVEMTEATGKCEGFGNELALGSKRLCEKYGHPELFMGVKGQAFAAYDGRGAQGM
ncbi:MAG: aldehyde ferredoxin oxidoreductase, partial [bacterium]|nr:aldehyde ferredoxin oxidoreductase [bacterium]